MIRIYLDWNVISNLKRPQLKEVKDFITKHKKYLLFPYTPAHFSDLMKSYTPNNEFFKIDLETLEFLADKHLLRWGKDNIQYLCATPTEYFDTEKDKEDFAELLDIEKIFEELKGEGFDGIIDSLENLLKSLPTGIEVTKESKDILEKMFPGLDANSTMWDLMKNLGPFIIKLTEDGKYYKDLRQESFDSGFKLEANSGNWEYDEVIENIDAFLHRHGVGMSYREYIDSIFELNKAPKILYDYYTTAYKMLDMIGYKVDKLPKLTDSMRNIQADADHSFYAGYCDYFVVMDKNLRIKSKVLYNEFNISTKVIEPSELITELSLVIDDMSQKTNFLDEAISFCDENMLVEYLPPSEKGTEEIYGYRLPKFHFNYFNCVLFRKNTEQDAVIFTFRKAFKNLSNSIYYTETETLIDSVAQFFGYESQEEFEAEKKEFVNGEENVSIRWSFDGGLILLEKEEESMRPILHYIVSTKEVKPE